MRNRPSNPSGASALRAITGLGMLVGGMVAAPAFAADGMPNCTPAFVAANLPDVATSLAVLNAGSSPPVAIATEDVAATASSPEYCDIKGTLITGEAADDPGGYGPGTAQFELMLPANWNGKLVYWGVGGAAGNTISAGNPPDGSEALSLGYATAISDTGHQGSEEDFTVMLNDPIVAVDYFYRATHDLTVSVKIFLPRFYESTAPLRAYFDGCSNGGRMGMKEVEKYPDDYDGVISGSPFISLDANAAGLGTFKGQISPGAWMSPGLLATVDSAVYHYCDGADGVVDGLIQNPMRCDPTPILQSLACKGAESDSCLSLAQIDYLKSYWGPLTDTAGNLIFPGMSFADFSTSGYIGFGTVPTPPSSNGPQPWGSDASSPIGWTLVDTMIRYAAGNSGFDALDFPVRTSLATPIVRPQALVRQGPMTGGVITNQALALYRAATEAGDADDASSLAPFLAKGGKIIMYHGLSDPLLSPYRSILFYQDTARQAGGYEKLQSQYRLFLTPGMGHCGGGATPNRFETLSQLANWVENGAAPDAIVATKYTNDDPSKPVLRSMPLCKYPEAARYDGHSPLNDAASWRCSPEDASMLGQGPAGIAAGMLLPR